MSLSLSVKVHVCEVRGCKHGMINYIWNFSTKFVFLIGWTVECFPSTHNERWNTFPFDISCRMWIALSTTLTESSIIIDLQALRPGIAKAPFQGPLTICFNSTKVGRLFTTEYWRIDDLDYWHVNESNVMDRMKVQYGKEGNLCRLEGDTVNLIIKISYIHLGTIIIIFSQNKHCLFWFLSTLLTLAFIGMMRRIATDWRMVQWDYDGSSCPVRS